VIEAGRRDDTIGRYVLPAIGERAGQIGRPEIVPNESSGLGRPSKSEELQRANPYSPSNFVSE
jgi:hypothetical protein